MPSSAVRLVCPLCSEQVTDGSPPAPGRCPSCGARVEGDAESAPEAVANTLGVLKIDEPSADELALALFTVTPARAREIGITIASDEREGFYRWWVFLREGADPRDTISRLIDAARA